MFSFVTSTNLIIFCIVLLHCCIYFLLSYNFLFTRSLLTPYAYVSMKSINCILLSLFELKVILLISSVKILCFSLLNLYSVFNINLLLFHKFFMIFCKNVSVSFIFSFYFVFRMSCF